MSIESVRNHPVWRNMSPVKKQVMEETLAAGRGKKLSDSAGIIMMAKEINRIKQAGESITKEETEKLTEELMKGMSAADKAKLELIKNMINNK